MKLAEFDFDLPEDLIAQRPLPDRSQARLMVVRRDVSKIEHRKIGDLPRLLARGDLLVFNDTRVIPARLHARRTTGGKVEVLLTRPLGEGRFNAMLRNVKGLAAGSELIVGDETRVVIESSLGGGFFTVRVDSKLGTMEALEKYGHIPLPPYIHREDDGADRSTYQTMFAREPGSAAAPTAGLHFTDGLMQELGSAGVDHTRLTLHVGPGTFLPVREEAEEDIKLHKMHSEPFEVTAAAADKIAEAKTRGSRVVAVGTTSMRTLESVARTHGKVVATKSETDIFITPGHQFLVADALLTNFHLPRSTLLMLVSAFAGMDLVRTAYQAAIGEKYRFFSYGDACLFL